MISDKCKSAGAKDVFGACFKDIIEFMETDIAGHFQEFSDMAKSYGETTETADRIVKVAEENSGNAQEINDIIDKFNC